MMKLKQAESKSNFYVASYSAGIEPGCVTPLYCNNSIQHKHVAVTGMHHTIKGWVYINISATQTSIVFGRGMLNNRFEFETIAALMQWYK